MKLLKGKKIADEILAKIKNDLLKRKTKPNLAVILVGEDKASEIYVKLKRKAAKKVGIGFKLIRYSKNTPQKTLISSINRLNSDKKVNGIIVQLPLPKKFDTQEIINSIDPGKDADGFHPVNVKYFLKDKTKVYPVFPRAIVRLLESSKIKLKDKNAIVIANSKEFGRIMCKALENKHIIADYFLTKNLKNNSDKLKKADIVVTASGIPGTANGNMFKKGVTVIDGGIAKINGKTVGDVNSDTVKNVASYLSPVPGGVGPVTIACLLENFYLLSKQFIYKS